MTHSRIVPLLLSSTAALACAGDPGQPTPNGAIEVTAVTGGEPPDPDGYTVAIDGAQAADLGVNSALALSDVPAGEHQLELAGVAPHCNLSGPNPRPVTVEGGEHGPCALRGGVQHAEWEHRVDGDHDRREYPESWK
jgi:hypothetical protein